MFNNKSEIEKVAIYTRVSTEDQAKEGYSLEAQMKKLRAYCISRDWEISKEYVDDGYTGRNTRRPGYQKMFEDIKLWDGVLVLKMDRIHRNSKNFMQMMDFLKKHNKEFVSSQESFDTSNAMGRFVMDIIQRIAQLESEQNAERVTMAMIQKAMDTSKGWVGHRLPYGYKKINNKIVEIPEEIGIIKQVFQYYADGKTMQEISNITGKAWSQIRYWLNNIWYLGIEQWGNCFKRIPIEPVISLDLWNMVQTRKRKAPGGRRLKPFILNEIPESFTLSDKEMREHGFSMDIIKNQVV